MNQQLSNIKGNTQYEVYMYTGHQSHKYATGEEIQCTNVCRVHTNKAPSLVTVSTFISEPRQHFHKLDMAWCELVLQV